MKTKNSSTLAVGIDVHKKRHYARVKIRQTRQIISPILKTYNSKRGLDFLLEKVNHFMEKYQAKGVIFALEPTGIYWKPLGYALHDRGCLVHLVNPVQVHYKRKEEDPAANKNDKIDPGLICDLVCDGKSNPAQEKPKGGATSARRASAP
jgi:transposase